MITGSIDGKTVKESKTYARDMVQHAQALAHTGRSTRAHTQEELGDASNAGRIAWAHAQDERVDANDVWASAHAFQRERGCSSSHGGMLGQEPSPGEAGLRKAWPGQPVHRERSGLGEAGQTHGLGKAWLGEPVHRERSGVGEAGQTHAGLGETAWRSAEADRQTRGAGAGQGGPWDAGRNGQGNFENSAQAHYPFCMVAEPVVREGLGPSGMVGTRGRAAGITAVKENCGDEVTEKSHPLRESVIRGKKDEKENGKRKENGVIMHNCIPQDRRYARVHGSEGKREVTPRRAEGMFWAARSG